jgi:hypothetical protein
MGPRPDRLGSRTRRIGGAPGPRRHGPRRVGCGPSPVGAGPSPGRPGPMAVGRRPRRRAKGRHPRRHGPGPMGRGPSPAAKGPRRVACGPRADGEGPRPGANRTKHRDKGRFVTIDARLACIDARWAFVGVRGGRAQGPFVTASSPRPPERARVRDAEDRVRTERRRWGRELRPRPRGRSRPAHLEGHEPPRRARRVSGIEQPPPERVRPPLAPALVGDAGRASGRAPGRMPGSSCTWPSPNPRRSGCRSREARARAERHDQRRASNGRGGRALPCGPPARRRPASDALGTVSRRSLSRARGAAALR